MCDVLRKAEQQQRVFYLWWCNDGRLGDPQMSVQVVARTGEEINVHATTSSSANGSRRRRRGDGFLILLLASTIRKGRLQMMMMLEVMMMARPMGVFAVKFHMIHVPILGRARIGRRCRRCEHWRAEARHRRRVEIKFAVLAVRIDLLCLLPRCLAQIAEPIGDLSDVHAHFEG